MNTPTAHGRPHVGRMAAPGLPQIVLLAGGLATRLRPLTLTQPKALVEVANRPFLDHLLIWLSEQGAVNVLLLLGYLGEQIFAHVGDGSAYGLRVAYTYDGSTLLGTGGTLRQALPKLDDAFVVLNSDTFVDVSLREFWKAYLASRAQIGLVVTGAAGRPPGAVANVALDEARVVRYAERGRGESTSRDAAAPSAPACTHTHVGVTAIQSAAVRALPIGVPCDQGALYDPVIAQRGVFAWETTEQFNDIGTPQGLARYEARVLQRGGATLHSGERHAW